MMASTASSKEVYDQNYKNLFGLYTPNDTLSEPIAALVKAKFPDVTRCAILARNDLSAGAGRRLKKSAEARGLQVVYLEKYTIGTLDHAAAITQIGAANPDWIVATGYINDLILIRQQMADQKVTAKVITGINGPQYQEWIDAVGAVGNGVTTASWFHSSVRYNSDDLFGDTQNFVKLFAAKYKSRPTSPRRPGSAIGVILQMAIEKAGTLDRDKVRSVLANTEFKTFFAPVKFGPDGQANSYTPPIFPDPGQESGREDLSRRDQAGRSAARGRTLMLALLTLGGNRGAACGSPHAARGPNSQPMDGEQGRGG